MVLTKAKASKGADKISKDVASILNEIKRKNVDAVETADLPAKQVKLDAKVPKAKSNTLKVPRGNPKSGRPWKEVKQK